MPTAQQPPSRSSTVAQRAARIRTSGRGRPSQPLFKASERFRLDPHSPLPLYHQMETIILDRINAEAAVGRMLPREVDLVEIFGVSRITVKKVTDSLVAKGVIRRQRAIGTHIVGLGVKEDLGRLASYTEQMAERGLSVSTEVLSVRLHVAPAMIRERLRLQPRERTLCVRRLRGTSQVFPVVLLKSDVPAHFGLDPKEDYGGSLYELMERKYGIRIDWAQEEISASQATAEEAHRLRIQPGDVVLVMERQTFTTGNRPLEFVRAVYRPEHYTFSVRLKR